MYNKIWEPKATLIYPPGSPVEMGGPRMLPSSSGPDTYLEAPSVEINNSSLFRTTDLRIGINLEDINGDAITMISPPVSYPDYGGEDLMYKNSSLDSISGIEDAYYNKTCTVIDEFNTYVFHAGNGQVRMWAVAIDNEMDGTWDSNINISLASYSGHIQKLEGIVLEGKGILLNVHSSNTRKLLFYDYEEEEWSNFGLPSEILSGLNYSFYSYLYKSMVNNNVIYVISDTSDQFGDIETLYFFIHDEEQWNLVYTLDVLEYADPEGVIEQSEGDLFLRFYVLDVSYNGYNLEFSYGYKILDWSNPSEEVDFKPTAYYQSIISNGEWTNHAEIAFLRGQEYYLMKVLRTQDRGLTIVWTPLTELTAVYIREQKNGTWGKIIAYNLNFDYYISSETRYYLLSPFSLIEDGDGSIYLLAMIYDDSASDFYVLLTEKRYGYWSGDWEFLYDHPSRGPIFSGHAYNAGGRRYKGGLFPGYDSSYNMRFYLITQIYGGAVL